MGVELSFSGNIWVWDTFLEGEGKCSIPRYVETHADLLREKFLALIHDIGQFVVGNKSVIEHFELDSGFSLWWMSLLAEKSFYKSPCIVECLRLLALEEILKNERPKQLILKCDEASVGESIKILCHRLHIQFVWRRSHRERVAAQYQPLKFIFLLPVKAMSKFARHALSCSRLKTKNPCEFEGKDSVFLCSYFDNLVPSEDGFFYSKYWGILPELFKEYGLQQNWLQLFARDTFIINERVGSEVLKKFNKNPQDNGQHTFLEAHLSISMMMSVMGNWIKKCFLTFRLKGIRSAFNLQGSNLSFWPLLKHDWYSSTSGPVAMENMLWTALFNAVMAKIPTQRLGFYLHEGQAWERAFIDAWKKQGHGKLIGVAHSTIRFWDLRCFNDARSLLATDELAMPQPDLLAVNGSVAWQTLVKAKFPLEKLIKVEAIRYLGLLQLINKKEVKPVSAQRQVLILGDYIFSNTSLILRTLASLPKTTLSLYNFVVKPHPNTPIEKKDYPKLDFEITNETLSEILGEFDMVYGSNATSATLDAYIIGKPVIVHLNNGEINFSPLRAQSAVYFVSNPEELMDVLNGSKLQTEGQSQSYFWLDSALPQWRSCINPKEVVQ